MIGRGRECAPPSERLVLLRYSRLPTDNFFFYSVESVVSRGEYYSRFLSHSCAVFRPTASLFGVVAL